MCGVLLCGFFKTMRFVCTGGDDPVGCFSQRSHRGFRRLRRRSLPIAVIDQNRFATCGVAGIDVAPAISHKETARQVDVVLALGLEQKSGQRLAASAIIRIIMIADEDIVNWQG